MKVPAFYGKPGSIAHAAYERQRIRENEKNMRHFKVKHLNYEQGVKIASEHIKELLGFELKADCGETQDDLVHVYFLDGTKSIHVVVNRVSQIARVVT